MSGGWWDDLRRLRNRLIMCKVEEDVVATSASRM